MPRVLIVTSMLPPYLAADSHRARVLANELPALGWDVELLVPGDAFQSPWYREPDAHLLDIPAPIHRAPQAWTAVFRALKVRSAGWRAYVPLKRLGDELLGRGRFDLVYFSCSQPLFFHLGTHWRKRFGVPFVLDFHDPWYWPVLPKARHLQRWKWRVSNALAGCLERRTLSQAAGVVSVSSGYLSELAGRYAGRGFAFLRPQAQAVIPFAPLDRDFETARALPAPQDVGSRRGRRTIVYTGAGGEIMLKSFRALCARLAAIRRTDPGLLEGVRIQLFGTDPLPGEREPLLSRVSAEAGLSDVIEEYPKRLGYLESLRRVMDADGLLILGVDHVAYNPSKLFLYGASGRPLLACMREGTVVDAYFERYPQLGRMTHFSDDAAAAADGDVAAIRAFLSDVKQECPSDRGAAPADWRAAAMARRHVELFARCLA